MSFVNPKIFVKDTGDLHLGNGAYAGENILKGEILCKSDGRILTNEEWKTLPNLCNDFCYDIDANHVFCPDDCENPDADWYINHSCAANAGSGGDIRTLVALRDIEKGEQITIDYAMFDEDPEWKMQCFCGAPNCRGWVRGTDWIIPDIQARYKGYFQKNIQEKIDVLKQPQ